MWLLIWGEQQRVQYMCVTCRTNSGRAAPTSTWWCGGLVQIAPAPSR